MQKKINSRNIKLFANILFFGNVLICIRYIFISSYVIFFSRFELISGDRFVWPFHVIIVNSTVFIIAFITLFFSAKFRANYSGGCILLATLLIALFTALEFFESIYLILKYDPINSTQVIYALIFPMIMMGWTIFSLLFYWLVKTSNEKF